MIVIRNSNYHSYHSTFHVPNLYGSPPTRARACAHDGFYVILCLSVVICGTGCHPTPEMQKTVLTVLGDRSVSIHLSPVVWSLY